MLAFINSTCLNLLMHSVKVKTTNSRDSQLPRGLSLIECWLVRFILFCQILAPRALGSSVYIYEYFRWTLYYKFSGSGSSHAGCSYPLQSPTWVFWPPNVSQKVFYHSFIPYRYSGVREKAMATMQTKWMTRCNNMREQDSWHCFLKSVNNVFDFHHSGYCWPV